MFVKRRHQLVGLQQLDVEIAPLMLLELIATLLGGVALGMWAGEMLRRRNRSRS